MNMILLLVTSFSLILAATMAAVAWRLAREERRRSQARVAALASDLDLEMRPNAGVTAAGAELFRMEEHGHAGSRFAAVLTIGVFAVATALALIVATSRAAQSVSEPVAAQATQPDAGLTTRSATESAPLELTALTHEREGDGIIVRGVVRNPTTGVDQDRVAAVVFVFTRDGAFLASGRSALAVPMLAPGSETAFVVTVPHANEVGRYRVSFRSNDRVVPHVDRRERSPIAHLQ
jgi:hypothetical protein